jgi:hypothetical protein
MGLASPAWRRVLGLFVIAHGFAHAVLPLRGWLQPDLFEKDAMPMILYSVAVMGFTTGGIGLLGVTPFTAVVRPALVLASVYSLISIFTFGMGDLWWGAAIDVVLLLTALTGIYRRLPAGVSYPGWRHTVAVALASAFMLYVGCAMVLWPLYRGWGSTYPEFSMVLPGDGSERNPALQLQHAVTINAAPDQVRARLVQFGQEHPRGAFVLAPTDDGGTRFIIRTTVGSPSTTPWMAAIDMLAFELPRFITERKMMLQIKALAEERQAGQRHARRAS